MSRSCDVASLVVVRASLRPAQRSKLGAQLCHISLERGHARGEARVVDPLRRHRQLVSLRSCRIGLVAPEEMAVALLLLSRSPLEPLDEIAAGERVQRFHDLAEIREAVESVGSLLELARSLRPAEEQDADHGSVRVGEPELLVEQLAVLRGTAPRPARKARPASSREPLERLVDLALLEADDRVAIRRLVTRQPKSIEREGVLVGRRPLLLEEAPEHSQLDRVGVHPQSVRRRQSPSSGRRRRSYGRRE